jgi:membrane protease YdiL (CAAX protease family)
MIDPSPRAPLWLRIVRHPVVRLLLLGTLMFFTMGFSNSFQEQLADRPLLAIAAAVGMVVLGLLVYAGFVRWVEGRRVSELALAPAGREFGIGLLGGAALYTACVLILMALGDFRIDGLNPVSFLLPGVAMALSSGFLEELLFRGALFRIVEEWLGSWISIVVSSLVFGLAHLANPAATLEGALFISVEAGLLFAATFMLTRRLWLGIGVHVAWNYTQSAIFSGAVSGNEAAPGLFRDTIQGPTILTGGAFGVELSLVAFLLCTGAGIALLVMAIRRGHVVQPFWKRRDAAAGAGAA